MGPQERRTRATVLGFVVALGILLALVYVVGIDEVLVAMAAVEPAVLLLLGVVVFAWIGTWSGSLHLTASAFEIETTVVESVLVYAHMMFLDNVIPFSSISADPFAALAVSRATATDYETSLATVITVDFLNFLPAPAFGGIGLVYLMAASPLGGPVETLAVALIALLLGLSVVGYLAWIRRRWLAEVGATAVVAALRAASSVLPRVSAPSGTDVRRRATSLVANLETVAGDRRTLLVVATFATAGWTLLAASLWLSLYAVGHAIPAGLALFLVSLVTVGELVPLPGGVGTSESLFVVLLVALAGTPPAAATAGVLVHRGATYWFPVVLGGGVVPLLLRDRL